MAKEEVTLQNFSGGELAPEVWGRYDLPVVKAGCRKLRNMIAETAGQSRFRTGFKLVNYTRGNRDGWLIPFQFNDEQTYQLEFTHLKLRFHKDEGVIVEADKTITAITSASPGVVTSAAHGYSNGDEVFITDVKGMLQVNGRGFIVANKTANTFELTDIDGVNVSTAAYGAYSSGGVANRVYELTTPYDEALDLTLLKVTQNADTMYIDHKYYEPRKLTRTAHTSWTLSLYTRTADPFLSAKVITGISQANPGVVTSVAHGYVSGDVIIIETVTGMTQINSRVYTVVLIGANTFSLVDYITGVAVDTTAYTAYAASGYASLQNLLPACPAFYEGRLFHGGMDDNPSQFIGSRSPVPTTGVPRYDDYTAGVDADHAVYYSIADGEVNVIRWLLGTNRLMMAGTFGTEVKITGETIDKAITPSSINVRAENRLGVADVVPINKENIVIYVQRGGLTLRSFKFETLDDRFISTDRNLVADHITKSGIRQICWGSGRPDIVWSVTNDGRLLGLTFKDGEDVSGWHQHNTGLALGDKFRSISSMPRPDNFDQLWAITERVIDGHTRRFVEFKTDEAEIPELYDFYTGDETADKAVYTLAMQEAQKEYNHLDCAITYDGSTAGADASASLTPSGVTLGDTINIVSDVALFAATDVGREIWKKAIDGVGQGRARIDTFTNTTQVVATVLAELDSAAAMGPGDWYFTTEELTNLWHLEGREVAIVCDGGVHPAQTVVDGAVALDYPTSKCHVGLAYTGFLQPVTVEAGGTTGPSQGKLKNIRRIGIKFLNTLGAEYGTNIYAAEEVEFAEMPLQIGAPQLLYSGVKDVHLTDSWEIDKTIFVRQMNPLPCIVQLLAVWCETDNDGG